MNISKEEFEFLKYINYKRTDTTFSARWMLYNIEPNQLIKKMINNKMLFIDNSVYSNLKSLNATELKKILKENGLNTKGTIKDLISRITESIDSSVLSNKFNNNIYVVNDTIKELVEKSKIKPSNDELWTKYNLELSKHTRKNDIGSMRVTYSLMANLLQKEKKYKQALQYYCNALFLDILDYTEIDKILSEHQPFRKIEIPEGIFIHINKIMLKINFDEDLYNYLKNCLLFTFFPAFPLSFNETLDIATNLIKKGKYLKYQIRKK